MDFIFSKTELVPGSWTIEPIEGVGPKTLTLCPIPGVDPTKVPTEISEVVSAPLLTTAKFNHVRNIHFTRGGVLLRGMCNRFENNVIDWCCWNGLAYGTSDNVIRGNKILWCGLTGFGSSGGARITFEKNLVSYCSWRPFAMGWHGGAIKIIPACIDFAMRDNEICYNDVAGLWYDTNNQGNLNEGNLLHDNFGPGGFDEYSFHNTWRYNLAYNNIGCGLGVCNSSGDTVLSEHLLQQRLLRHPVPREQPGHAQSAGTAKVHDGRIHGQVRRPPLRGHADVRAGEEDSRHR